METIQTNDNKFTFSAKISDTLANSIRRYVNEVPTLAIDEVEIAKNDSPLYDETLAHRMGLVVFKMDSSYKDDTEVKISLKVKSPGTVCSGAIKTDAEIVYDKLPLTILKENKEINIKGTARTGKGSYHTKYAPGFIFYRHAMELSTDKSLSEEIKAACPEVNMTEKGDTIIINDNAGKEVCDVCEGIAEKNQKEMKSVEKDEMILSIESYGQMAPKDIFKKSVEILKKDLQSLSKNLK